MKVIHILHELKFSGAEIMYVDAASLFQAKGCELSVIATAENIGEYAPYFENAGYNLFNKPYPKLKNYLKRIVYYYHFVQFLKSENYDIVHIHASVTMWGMALCAWIAGKRSVYTFHNVFPTHFYSYFYHCLLRWSAKNIFNCNFQTISDSVYEHELKLYHNDTTKIYNWYGSNRFYPAKAGEKYAVREELSIPQDALVLISVGGCSPVKRHSEIIKALPLINEKHPNCIYLHLGKGESECSEINLATELNVSSQIRFYENQSDVRKFLIAADIYMMPSRFEGIPITTIEAMGCLIPTILYNVPGLCDFNKNGENSILIPEDYKFLAEKAIYLHANPDVALQMAMRAKEFVDFNFNIIKNTPLIFNLYAK